jgi:hypothetical protein
MVFFISIGFEITFAACNPFDGSLFSRLQLLLPLVFLPGFPLKKKTFLSEVFIPVPTTGLANLEYYM